MNLRGKRALVTGGARRIGAAIALALAERGCDVVLHCHGSVREAQSLARKIAGLGVSAEVLRADLSRPSQALALARKALKKPLDLLVNNASVYERVSFEWLSLKHWERALAVNLTAVLLLSRTVGLAMKKRGGGRIVNIADTAGEQPYRGYLPYCVSKGGLLSLTRALAVELAPEVHVNSICPGPVLPAPAMDGNKIERLARKTPLKKWGGAGEVAKAVTFLVQSDFTTGANIVVDGGFQLV